MKKKIKMPEKTQETITDLTPEKTEIIPDITENQSINQIPKQKKPRKPRSQNLTTHLDDIVEKLIDCLKSGTGYKNAQIYISAYYPMAKRTFDKYWVLARQAYEEEIKNIRAEGFTNRKRKILNRVKVEPITKRRVLEELLIIVEKGQDRDKINALKLVCDIEGYKAPVKQDLTLTPVTPIFNFNPLIDNVIDITGTNDD